MWGNFKKIIILLLFVFVQNVIYGEKVTDYVSKSDVNRGKKIFLFKVIKEINNSDNVKPNVSNDTNNIDSKKGENVKSEDKKNEKSFEIVLKNKKAKEIIEKLDGFMGYKMIGLDNKIIVNGDEKRVDEIKKIISNLDIAKKQVIIKATIIDTSINLFEKIGVNLGINSDINNKNNENFIFKFLNGELSVSNLLLKGSNILGIDFNLLKENGDIKIESMPTIMILDGEEGELKVTEEVLIGEKKVTKNNSEYSEPIFSEAGIVFKIMPEILSGVGKEKIKLKIETEVSNFKLTSNYSETSGAKQKNHSKTSIILDSGSTVFLGGLKQNVEKDTIRKVPFISSIPIIGELFKYKKNNKENRDIYIEIEAYIQ